MSEFNLSEKISLYRKDIGEFIKTEDVKEFIKLLKAEYHVKMSWKEFVELIDKLAGDELK